MNIFDIALQDLDIESEDSTILTFKTKYNLERGFYKKPVEFFYWLYKKEYDIATEKEFKKSFIGRMVKFNKNSIPNYTELVLEYEKEKYLKKIKACATKKIKLKRLSKARQVENNES